MKNLVISIGRSKENDIVLNDDTVSRQHAQLIISKNKFELIDNNSTNGTFINNKRIKNKFSLTQGDVIQFGAFQFDWNLVESFIEKQKVTTTQLPKSGFIRNTLPLVFVVGISLLLYWFLTTEKKSSDNNEANAEISEASLDTVDNVQTKVLINSDSLHIKKPTETQEETLKQPRYTRKSEELNYSISCLRSKSTSNELIGFGADIEDGWITFSSDEVSVNEEVKVGEELLIDVSKKYKVLTSSNYHMRINGIFNQLISVLDKPRMNYQWHIIESEEINAFTAGGQIFITIGIIEFAINNDELACVIAHEIYHNELGHINKLIRKEKAAKNWFGDYADWTLIASNILGASFNQKNEAYCDMYGVDLAIKAGYDGKAASEFWSRMKSSSNQVEKIFSTHPFSEERMSCIEEHLERNYKVGQ